MNELTKAQKEYFKDSKVRDQQGNLLVCYHGSRSRTEFDTFDNVKTEPGYWFSEDEDYASSHGTQTFKCYLNLKNPFNLEAPGNDDLLWVYAKDCFKTSDVGEKQIFSNQFRDYLQEKGFDGMMWIHSGAYTIVAFEPNQIKSIDNLFPTLSDNFMDNSEEYKTQPNLSLSERLEIAKYIKSKGIGDDGGAGAPPACAREREEVER